MPFKITKEMILMAEAEQGFSAEVRLAQFREMAEYMRWSLRRPLRRVLRSAHPWGTSPEMEDTFRLSSPNFLYLLAQETRNGNYSHYERFLHYLGFDVTGDAIAMVDERLRITFEPGGNNRREWWKEPSHEAAEWLRRKIAEKPRSEHFIELDAALIDPKDKRKDKRKLLDPDLREFELREAVHAALPEKRAQVVMLYAMLHDEARPRETTKAVAEYLQISPATVRWHKAEAHKDHGFRKMLGLS